MEVINKRFLIILATAFIPISSLADDCPPRQLPDGSWTTDCPSQAPVVTLPSTPTRPVNYNSCQYAFNGHCDDATYSTAESAACPTGTDESDCNPRMRRGR